MKEKQKVFGEISEMFLFVSVAGGALTAAGRLSNQQGSNRKSKQTCTVAYKPWTDSVLLVMFKSKDHNLNGYLLGHLQAV